MGGIYKVDFFCPCCAASRSGSSCSCLKAACFSASALAGILPGDENETRKILADPSHEPVTQTNGYCWRIQKRWDDTL